LRPNNCHVIPKTDWPEWPFAPLFTAFMVTVAVVR
jgi:hypothetical protein